METVSIQEASRRLHLPTASIRACIKAGELKAYRSPGPDGRSGWVVELPPDGWTSSAMAQEMERPFSPWWWANAHREGSVHYVQDLFASSFEEMIPRFLCGLVSANIWVATDITEDMLCPECLQASKLEGLQV